MMSLCIVDVMRALLREQKYFTIVRASAEQAWLCIGIDFCFGADLLDDLMEVEADPLIVVTGTTWKCCWVKAVGFGVSRS